MPLLTISDAARRCGVDRRTLQRAIASGRLTRTASGQVTLEALQQAGYAAPMSQVTPQDAAWTPQVMTPTPHDAAHTPQGFAPELVLATTLLTHLADLTRTIAALHQEVVLLREDLRQTPQRRRSLTPQVAPQDAAPLPHHDTLTPQETPQSAAPMSQVVRHAAEAPQSRPATPEGAPTLPAHVLAIAETAMQYDKLTLGELAQLLFDRGIYRARDRKTGADKLVNRGTLGRWLDQARAAGVL